MSPIRPNNTHLRVNDVFIVHGSEEAYGRLVNHWFKVTSLDIDNEGNRHLSVVSTTDPSFYIGDITEYGFNVMGRISKMPRD